MVMKAFPGVDNLIQLNTDNELVNTSSIVAEDAGCLN
jgi:hypothetical protein